MDVRLRRRSLRFLHQALRHGERLTLERGRRVGKVSATREAKGFPPVAAWRQEGFVDSNLTLPSQPL